MPDLDAIRARDAAALAAAKAGLTLSLADLAQAPADRHDLLAEVDRLNLLVAHIPSRAVYAERARIAAEVRGLPDPRHAPPWLPDDLISRAAVLAIIEGAGHD